MRHVVGCKVWDVKGPAEVCAAAFSHKACRALKVQDACARVSLRIMCFRFKILITLPHEGVVTTAQAALGEIYQATCGFMRMTDDGISSHVRLHG